MLLVFMLGTLFFVIDARAQWVGSHGISLDRYRGSYIPDDSFGSIANPMAGLITPRSCQNGDTQFPRISQPVTHHNKRVARMSLRHHTAGFSLKNLSGETIDQAVC
jgi:hypothetical protein